MSWFEEALKEADSSLVPSTGLGGMKSADKSKVSFADTRLIEGSIDMDAALAAAQPNAARWDYALAYDGGAWYLEVHPASGDAGINDLVAKAQWLKSLIEGTELKAKAVGFFWIASGKVSSTLSFSRKKRRLATAGIIGPFGHLRIPADKKG